MATVYPFETLDVIHKQFGNDQKIKKIFDKRIKELKKNGFYIDMIEHKSELYADYMDVLQKTTNELNIDIDINDYFEVVGNYVDDQNLSHSFIHVKPKDFTFKYVCFDNMSNIFNLSNTVVYANSFWGIYIENEKLQMHELIQYEFFKDYFIIAPYNLYDGGNGLLPYSNKYKRGIVINHTGAIFKSWEDFVDTTIRYIKCDISDNDTKIVDLQNKIKLIKSANTKNKAKLKQKVKFFSTIEM